MLAATDSPGVHSAAALPVRRVGHYGLKVMNACCHRIKTVRPEDAEQGVRRAARDAARYFACGELLEDTTGRELHGVAVEVGLDPVRSWELISEGFSSGKNCPSVPRFLPATAGLRLEALRHPEHWKGKGGATDWVVLNAHLFIADRARSVAYGASVRELGLLADVAPSTAAVSTERLIQRGYLNREPQSDKSHEAACFSIQQPSAGEGDATRTIVRPLSNSKTVHVVSLGQLDDPRVRFAYRPHDAWRWAGLGPALHRLFCLLQVGVDWTLRDLAAAYGAHHRTVRGHMNRLAEVGLATLKGGTCRPTSKEDLFSALDDAAAMLNVAGKGEAQRQRDIRARAGYTDFKRARSMKRSHRERRSGNNRFDPETGEVLVRLRFDSRLSSRGPDPAATSAGQV